MPVFVSGTNHHHLNHELIETQLINCDIEVFDWEKDPLVENSLIIHDPSWINLQQLPQEIIQHAKNIKNKRILLIYDYKSFASKSDMIKDTNAALVEMDFNPTDVYIITQLEYDIEYIKNVMPEANVISRDRWLKELFKIQVTPYSFKEFGGYPQPEYDLSSIDKKRFSIFIRRNEKSRFEFMCELIALGLEPQLRYTFANTESSSTHDHFKQLIPERLNHARDILEPWIEGIPYSVEFEQHDHMHYPIHLKHYFEKSDINIVFETEPFGANTIYSCNGFGSFLTEKTYKAILFKKPFIIVSEQHGLKALRKFGFQTFSPWIDESYDDIEDFDLRVAAILSEIKRLSLLSDDDITKLLAEIDDIIKHNHEVLYDLAYASIPEHFKLKSLLTF